MNKANKYMTGSILIVIVALFQITPALARSDAFIQKEIKAQIAESEKLRGIKIEVYVQQGLVVLTGQVRLYEQKLISNRIAWTTPGVIEVDNEIRVVPTLLLSDTVIEFKIREIVKSHAHLLAAKVVIAVDNGVVTIQGSFSEIGDPLFLKHKVAEIEGVVDIKINAAFLAQSNVTES